MAATNLAGCHGAFRESVPKGSVAGASTLKVVHVVTDLGVGGAEVALCRLLENGGHSSTGITHSVVSLMGGGVLGDRIRAAGIEVEELDLARGSVPVGRVFRLAEIIRRQGPNIIQGWLYQGILAATVANYLQSRPCPLVWGIHHSPGMLQEEKARIRMVVRLERLLSRLPAAIVYCARESARQHESLGYSTEKSVLIPNGFDTEAFKADPEAKSRLAAEIGTSPDTLIIGVVTRFHPNKDPKNVLAAAALLPIAKHNYHLVLVGRGMDGTNPDLAEAIRSLGLEARTTLLGRRDDVARLIAGFDIFCSCSASESFPIVLGEAMASGVPCVATDVGDSALIVGGTGIVVPRRDPKALADGLSRLIALGPEGRHRLGQAARRRIIEHFGLAEVVRQYEALYRRVGEQSRVMHR
jgi:glycosyltransferase involved in cell wall biosynthesis